jgi:hypothetical protein
MDSCCSDGRAAVNDTAFEGVEGIFYMSHSSAMAPTMNLLNFEELYNLMLSPIYIVGATMQSIELKQPPMARLIDQV